MRSIMAVAVLLLALAMIVGRDAEAGNKASAAHSIIPARLIVCPAGDSEFSVEMRDINNLPTPGNEFQLRFWGCPDVHFPPVLGNEGYQLKPNSEAPDFVETYLDGWGRATLRIRAGGTCPALWLLVGSMQLVTRAVASHDQDGNLGVGSNDLALAEAKLGGADPTADFNGDGSVTAADLDILRGHLGHHAPGMATPVTSRSWGAIKLLYQ